jgi:tetratricopeptide (TPR) repeat protein/peroxiredoxin
LFMSQKADQQNHFSRRDVLRSLAATPFLLKPSPMFGRGFLAAFGGFQQNANKDDYRYAASRYKPHYREQIDLTPVLKLIEPGTDDYATEKYAFEIGAKLTQWAAELRHSTTQFPSLGQFLDDQLDATTLVVESQDKLRSGFGLEATRRHFSETKHVTSEQFAGSLARWLEPLRRVETAEFDIYEITLTAGGPLTVQIAVRYDLVGSRANQEREERVGTWRMTCIQKEDVDWRVTRWEAGPEVQTSGMGGFADITSHALGENASYAGQMLRGVDYWRTVLDGACGMDIYANNGVATGDYDNDGFDDIYVCQPSGLPNRLYRNRGDGTFEDVTERAGVGLLDNTACALFADFDNSGLQDLLIVCGSGPLLYRNQGDGTFKLKPKAFEFAALPQGTFTHAAVADYDNDGRLDIYFCTYMYYLGLDQYHYPAPYYDARNGPPNILMHNEGGGRFIETTEAAGLNVENNRYSFACAWGDSNETGHPDLCIANDFGTSQLYRNRGDGTFSVASKESHIEDVGAGMSACWCDFDNDGHQDIYITSMWEPAGQRVSAQPQFHPHAPERIRADYQRHARGNALYRNAGDGTYRNAGEKTGTAMGRWSWSADFWDVDHDGFPDLYVANGYVSAVDRMDLDSFFWRQIVAKSPEDDTALKGYERGWNAINELIRSDKSWNGFQRNVMFGNNRDGTFSEISGVVGLDCMEDSRAFALADIDHDGRLEVILKNRNAPQLRILHNNMRDLGHSICFRLRGHKSNRDAIGASITLESGDLVQTRYLQAGTGFLSQHSKEIFFGVGRAETPATATVRWPNGTVQKFNSLLVNHRIELEEGVDTFAAKPFATQLSTESQPSLKPKPEVLPTDIGTWLITPLRAPGFVLPDIGGTNRALKDFTGSPLLLHFWSNETEGSRGQLRSFEHYRAAFAKAGASIVTINLDNPDQVASARATVKEESLTFPALFATEAVAAIYNIIFRYLFDRRRDLALPTSFLLNGGGMIEKVYQGTVDPEVVLQDAHHIPQSPEQRLKLALPFHGELIQGTFQRNEFTYGVALFQHGYLDEAAESFRQVVAVRPNDPEAYYNLGTLNLRRNDFEQAKQYLEKTIALRPNYPEAWNNLGMMAGQQGDAQMAIEDFKKALELRPDYEIAVLNLGNVYRRQKAYAQADEMLSRALALRPDDPEVNYSLGMLYAQQTQMERAAGYLQKAIDLRPDYSEAINNLGIVFVRTEQMDRAEQMFKRGIDVAPDNDQAYLNLARVYAMRNDRQDARDILQRLLHRQPQNSAASRALEMLQ